MENKKFYFLITCGFRLMKEALWRTGTKYYRLRMAFGGIFQVVSTTHRFWHVKLHKSTKFHAGIIFCTIVIDILPGIGELLVEWCLPVWPRQGVFSRQVLLVDSALRHGRMAGILLGR